MKTKIIWINNRRFHNLVEIQRIDDRFGDKPIKTQIGGFTADSSVFLRG